jgi:hypothetical protein
MAMDKMVGSTRSLPRQAQGDRAEYQVNRGQLAKIHILLAQMNLDKDKEYKADLVQQYTQNRETSTAKLTWKEAQDMIADLTRAAGPNPPTSSGGKTLTADDLKADAKRKRILHYAHLMGHELRDGKVDMEWVNGWCQKYGYLHKELNAYLLPELSKLVWQMEETYKHFLKSI